MSENRPDVRGVYMYTEAKLKKQLSAMKIPHDGALLVHSSYKSMGEIKGGAETVVDVLCDYMSEGLLLAPTHSWDTVDAQHNTYDPSSTPSCTGIIGQLLLKRKGAIRTLHPTHSMAVYGKNAEKFAEGEEYRSTPCPRNGCMGKLLDMRGSVLFIGCPLTKNTFIHGIEEWSDVPNRLGESYTCYIIRHDGSIFLGSMQPHESPCGDVSRNFGKLEKPFFRLGVAVEGQFGDARCVLCNCRRMTRLTSELLIFNQDLFLDDEPVSDTLLDSLKKEYITI